MLNRCKRSIIRSYHFGNSSFAENKSEHFDYCAAVALSPSYLPVKCMLASNNPGQIGTLNCPVVCHAFGGVSVRIGVSFLVQGVAPGQYYMSWLSCESLSLTLSSIRMSQPPALCSQFLGVPHGVLSKFPCVVQWGQ